MADKKVDEKEQFEAEVYKLGLKLIEDYRNGNCRDSYAVLEAIIDVFKISRAADGNGR